MNREEVAVAVYTSLRKEGIGVVLSGGSVVSIYSENEYESNDLDFVKTGLSRRLDHVMVGLGFVTKDRYWVHPDSPYWIDFNPGPVEIGNRVLRDCPERSTPAGPIRMLTPTECVMDRLAWYFHDDDTQALDQAIAVALRQHIELDEISRWADEEGCRDKFLEFQNQLLGTAEA